MLIFGTGVVTGGLLVRYVDQTSAHHPKRAQEARPSQSWSPGSMRLDFLRRVGAELDLTPEQRESVDKILKDSQERTHKLMEPVAPKLREEFQRAKEEFRAVLTPEQLKRFDEINRQQQRPREQRHPSSQRPSILTNELPATTNL